MTIINNPLGAHGENANATMYASTVNAKASAAVGALDVVSINTDGTVDISATDGTAVLCIGIAPESIAAAETGIVVTEGLVEGVSADGSISAGDILKRSTNTAGHVEATATPAQGEAIGFAIAASASNVVDVWVGPVQDT